MDKQVYRMHPLWNVAFLAVLVPNFWLYFKNAHGHISMWFMLASAILILFAIDENYSMYEIDSTGIKGRKLFNTSFMLWRDIIRISYVRDLSLSFLQNQFILYSGNGRFLINETGFWDSRDLMQKVMSRISPNVAVDPSVKYELERSTKRISWKRIFYWTALTVAVICTYLFYLAGNRPN